MIHEIALDVLAACSAAPGGSLLTGLAVAGLFSGFMHCAAMCGPILLSVGAGQAGRPSSLLLHMGRLATYAGLGAASAGLNRLIWADSWFGPIAVALLALAGFLMVMAALPPTRLMMAQALAGLYRPFAPFIYRRIGSLRAYHPVMRLLFAGALLGFMPCSMILAALLAASATGRPLLAAAGMAAFVIGTLPGLLVATRTLRRVQTRWPRQTRWVEPVAMAASAIILLSHARTILS